MIFQQLYIDIRIEVRQLRYHKLDNVCDFSTIRLGI